MYSVLVKKFIYPMHEKIMGRQTFAYLQDLEKQQRFSPDRLEELRFRKLKELLIHARNNIPFYTQRFSDAGFDPDRMQSIDDIKKLPFLTKADIKQNLEQMTWKNCPGGLHRYNTGGSSGEPLIFYFDKRRQAWDKAARMLTHRWWGIDVGDKELYLWGSPVEATRQDRIKDLRDRLTNELLISAFEISEARVGEIIATFKRFRPSCVFGYPSTIDLFCKMADKQGHNLSGLGVKVIFTTAELLYDHQRESISDHFGSIPVADGYGSREGGFVSHQCREGNYHIMDPNYVIEYVKDDLPAAEGEDGEIILSHLDAWGMPLIRYRTGDVAQPVSNKCTCGCTFNTMERIQGRTTDFVVTPDGRWQHALSVIYIVRDIPGVDKFKIIQHAVDEMQVLVKLIPSLFPDDGEKIIIQGIKKRMGEEVDVRVEFVEEIPHESSGKYRYVVSHVAQNI